MLSSSNCSSSSLCTCDWLTFPRCFSLSSVSCGSLPILIWRAIEVYGAPETISNNISGDKVIDFWAVTLFEQGSESSYFSWCVVWLSHESRLGWNGTELVKGGNGNTWPSPWQAEFGVLLESGCACLGSQCKSLCIGAMIKAELNTGTILVRTQWFVLPQAVTWILQGSWLLLGTESKNKNKVCKVWGSKMAVRRALGVGVPCAHMGCWMTLLLVSFRLYIRDLLLNYISYLQNNTYTDVCVIQILT